MERWMLSYKCVALLLHAVCLPEEPDERKAERDFGSTALCHAEEL